MRRGGWGVVCLMRGVSTVCILCSVCGSSAALNSASAHVAYAAIHGFLCNSPTATQEVGTKW